MDKTQSKDTATAGLLSHVHQSDAVPSSVEKERQNDSGLESVEFADEKVDLYIQPLDENETPEYHNGEPVITTGRDVSRFAVDIRDDGDESLTFRSIFLGTVFAGMGAALCQVSTMPTTAYYFHHRFIHLFTMSKATCPYINQES